jgi:dienelactone hydrolase
MTARRCLWGWLILTFVGADRLVAGEDRSSALTFAARDSLQIDADPSPDAEECLQGLRWNPEEFTVTVDVHTGDGPYAWVRFPSPVPSGDETNDLVALEWYAPKNPEGGLISAPAVVVVHESGSRMEVGRLFAKALYAKGFHAFMIQLPYYGLRRPKNLDTSDGSRFLTVMKQAIADVRRARDAVAALPQVAPRRVSLQGTSLGGFVAATTAGLDRGYDQVFIMVAGGDLPGLIMSGQREAAELRNRLARAGYEGDKLRSLLHAIEPTRLAHRIDAERLWLYTAKDDQVVPRSSSLALLKAAGLADDHHVELWGDHYRVIVYFPVIVDHMTRRLREPPAKDK